MRIALVSDIHGNLPALRAVLNDLDGQDVDLVVNLGDLLSGAVQPRETADRLIELAWPTVRGNQERQLLELSANDMGESDRFAYASIAASHRDWLRTLPAILEPIDGVLAFHGTPDDDLQYLLETVDASGLRHATQGEILARLGSHSNYALIACGHSHRQGERRLSSGQLVVNPGSVGWPAYSDDKPFHHRVEAGFPHARYSIVEDSSGDWLTEPRSVSYDWELSAHYAEVNGRPDVAHALRTGVLTT